MKIGEFFKNAAQPPGVAQLPRMRFPAVGIRKNNPMLGATGLVT